jgi:hypothetical protein
MVADIFRVIVLILLPTILMGQSIDLSVSSPTSNNSTSTFLLEKGEVSINSNSMRFLRSGKTVDGYDAIGVSPDNSIVSLLKRTQNGGEVVLLNSTGDTLNTYSTVSLAQNDPSLALYASNSGDVLLRDNITNFTFYDTFGDIKTNMSSSSQSKEGEAISEVAMSPGGKTVVIYNPKIKRNGNLGSKAEVKLPGGNFENIFFSNDRYIRDLKVSKDGDLVAAITAKSGTDDQVLIMDKYGNELNTISTEQNLIGAAFSNDGKHLTIYSDGRIMVYNTLDGERLQGVSLRSPIFLADYFNDDHVLLVLTGSYSERTDVMNNVEFRAIDLEKQEITSKEFPGALGFSKAITPRFERISADTYLLKGANKEVTIETNF